MKVFIIEQEDYIEEHWYITFAGIDSDIDLEELEDFYTSTIGNNVLDNDYRISVYENGYLTMISDLDKIGETELEKYFKDCKNLYQFFKERIEQRNEYERLVKERSEQEQKKELAQLIINKTRNKKSTIKFVEEYLGVKLKWYQKVYMFIRDK